AILKEHETGVKTADLCRKHGISEASFYNWKAVASGRAGLRTPKWKLKYGEQRLAPQTDRSRAENLETAEQRLGRASLNRGNVGGSHTPGNHTAETALRG